MKPIRTQVEETTSDYDREKLQERLAKLVGGVAVIKVGAAAETEMKEKKARVKDAMHATKAAVEEGIVPGGGVALLRAGKALDALKLDGDERVGAGMIRKAIAEPLRWIATDAGQEGSTSSPESEGRQGRRGLQRRHRQVPEPGQRGCHRPGKGRAHRPSERLVDCLAPAHYRGPRLEIPEEKKESGGGGYARRRRHGRNVLICDPRTATADRERQGRLETLQPAFLIFLKAAGTPARE